MKSYGFWNHAGDFVRIGSGLAVAGEAVRFYNGVKDHVLGEIVDHIGHDLTGSIDIPLGAYGVGEGVNFYRDFRNDRQSGYRQNVLEWVGRGLRIAPAAAPILAMATDGDFMKSVLAPAVACIAGYGVQEIGKLIRRK